MDGTRGTERGGGDTGFDVKTGNRSLWKLKRWWVDNIKIGFK
jgi:hypothetical protein